MEDEIWKDIPGYEGRYKISNYGKVWSNFKKDFMSISVDKDGYSRVALFKDGKQKQLQVHRLVALTFIPNPENKPEVNHKDRNKSNNNVENLEWVTQSENVAHAYRHGVEPRPTHQDQPFQKEILDIIENKKYFSIREASRQTGHKRDTIRRSLDLNIPICNNTHHFIYVN